MLEPEVLPKPQLLRIGLVGPKDCENSIYIQKQLRKRGLDSILETQDKNNSFHQVLGDMEPPLIYTVEGNDSPKVIGTGKEFLNIMKIVSREKDARDKKARAEQMAHA